MTHFVQPTDFNDALRLDKEGLLEYNKNTLGLLNKKGVTLGFELALDGRRFYNLDLLQLRNKDNSLCVAHACAMTGQRFTDKRILELHDERYYTVAHEMAYFGALITDRDILMMYDDKGTTVAHAMASRGFTFKDPRILSLEDKTGWTVRMEVLLRNPL